MPVELFGATKAAGKIASGFSPKPQAAAGGAADGVADALGRLLDGVEETAGDANTAIGNMLDKTGEVHDAMIALQRAEMSLQLTVQLRNKFVSAYQDIMRMPI